MPLLLKAGESLGFLIDYRAIFNVKTTKTARDRLGAETKSKMLKCQMHASVIDVAGPAFGVRVSATTVIKGWKERRCQSEM
jgi:hypothetical protein